MIETEKGGIKGEIGIELLVLASLGGLARAAHIGRGQRASLLLDHVARNAPHKVKDLIVANVPCWLAQYFRELHDSYLG